MKNFFVALRSESREGPTVGAYNEPSQNLVNQKTNMAGVDDLLLLSKIIFFIYGGSGSFFYW